MTRWIVAALAFLFASAPSLAADSMTPGTLDASITGFEQGRAVVHVTAYHAPLRLAVPNADIQKSLLAARPGDSVQIVVDNAAKPTAVTAMTSLTRTVALTTVFWALLGSFALIAGLSALFLRGRNPLVGADGRYSNSQTQLALWFVTVATVYVATNVLRAFVLGGDFIGGVGVTAHVIALTGLSAFTFGAAKVAAVQKSDGLPPVPAPAASAGTGTPATPLGSGSAVATPVAQGSGNQAAPVSPAKTMALKARLSDLVCDDQGKPDLGDLQMIFITLAAVIIFICQSFWWLAALLVSPQVVLPDVDTALLATFGLGQGAYLFKKVAAPNG